MNLKKPTRRGHYPVAPTGLRHSALILSGAMLPFSASAAPTLSFGDITIQAVANVVGVEGIHSTPPPTTLPAGDPRKVEVFLSPAAPGAPGPFNGYALATPTLHPDQAYASAQMNGSGFADVGVSAMTEGPFADSWYQWTAALFSKGRITNVGDTGQVKLDYKIPLLEIATTGNRWNGEVAYVRAHMVADRYDRLGNFLISFDVFDYRLNFTYDKPPTDYAQYGSVLSEDLYRDSAGFMDLGYGCGLTESCIGSAIAPFSATKSLGILETGDYVNYTYVIDTFLITGREGGGHALFGDPFAFGGDGSRNFFEFSGVDVPGGAAPEPASLALLGIGLTALGWRRRRIELAP